VVYVVGLEEGLLPHERAVRSGERHDLEEERRLLFVGMTRARERLFLTQAQRRSIHGREMPTIPSLFAGELECDRITFAPDEDTLPQWQQIEIDERLARHREEAAGGKLSFESKPVLTTGAALLSGKGPAAAIPLGFQQGQQVRHPRYGRGIVTQTDGYGARRTVTVRFDEPQQVKTFTLAQCPLQPIGT
jgi:DNA helicase II / ATP-dependent DNA helicase PcrA